MRRETKVRILSISGVGDGGWGREEHTEGIEKPSRAALIDRRPSPQTSDPWRVRHLRSRLWCTEQRYDSQVHGGSADAWVPGAGVEHSGE
jgi:hypothetical protein